MGDGTKENPYTREDVKNLIKDWGTSDGLKLSGKVFEKCIDLKGFDLHGILLNNAMFLVDDDKYEGAHLEGAILWDAHLEGACFLYAHFEGADLSAAHLEGAILSSAHLEKVKCWEAHLEGADLKKVNLDNANLRSAHLEGVNLRNAEFTSDTQLETTSWGNYILSEEREIEEIKDKQVRTTFFTLAADTYRRLKNWYKEHGIYDVAGKFYYREREASRKASKRLRDRIAGWLSWAVFGHGEGWKRILVWIAGLVSLFSIIYYIFGTLTPNSFLDSLYYSAASFVALGYGAWVEESIGWAKGLGVFETFLGFFMMTLLLVTFVRKWAR